MPKIIRPPRLKPGDAVALLSPASPPENMALVKRSVAWLSKFGWKVKLGKNIFSQHGYLAGIDTARAADLTAAFLDIEIKAIFCTRGGYGCSRLLEDFDPGLAAQHPKIVVGFSDITTLHLSLQKQGMVTFGGPMPSSAFFPTPFSTRWLKRALTSVQPLGFLPVAKNSAGKRYFPGKASGLLTGGTLTLLCSSLGTRYEVVTRGRIVFLEETGEEPYKVDRMLTHLLAAGKLADAAGIVLGNFTQSEPKIFSKKNSLTLAEVFQDRLAPLKIPTLSGLRAGHMDSQLTLPYNVMTRLDAAAGSVEVLEAGVS
jgi:muramoyltetrapeptide carboxypeptidase